MLLMLQFRSEIAACGISMRCVIWGLKACHTVSKTFYFCGWKASLVNQHRGERGWLTPRRTHRNGRLFDSNVFFFCLPLLFNFQTKCNGNEETQVILILGAWIYYHTGDHFIYLGDVKTKHWLLNWPAYTSSWWLCSPARLSLVQIGHLHCTLNFQRIEARCTFCCTLCWRKSVNFTNTEQSA